MSVESEENIKKILSSFTKIMIESDLSLEESVYAPICLCICSIRAINRQNKEFAQEAISFLKSKIQEIEAENG